MFIFGHKPWNKGKKYPAPWLDEFRFGNRPKAKHDRSKYSVEERKRIWGAARRSKPITPAHLQAMIDGNRKAGHKNGYVHTKLQKEQMQKWALDHRDFMRKSGLKGNVKRGQLTSIEKIIYQKLKDWGIVYEIQKEINGKFIVDAFIPDHNIVIEVDGSYWHNLDRIKKKDKAENAYLKKCGYKVIRIPEKNVSDFSIATLKNMAKIGGE